MVEYRALRSRSGLLVLGKSMDSELQIALVGLGVAAVVGIIAYNKWQERKHSQHAEKTFRRDTRDVLLDPAVTKPVKDRVEPVLGDEVSAKGVDAHGEVEPVTEAIPLSASTPAPAPSQPSGRHKTPGFPDVLDARVDCMIQIESIEALDATRLWPLQRDQLQGLEKQVRWFAFDDRENVWRELNAHSVGAYHWFCATMQLVDRRGPIDERQFVLFSEGVQRLADQFLAVPANVPGRASVLQSAAEIDNFCASVDIQIGINIVTEGEPFAGTKIRALAEAGGLTLANDGAFHAVDDDGRVLFTMANLEPGLFAASEMRNLTTRGLTLVLDVPVVPDGVHVFDRMMRQAKQMADTLQGIVVDDNRSPISLEAAQLIRTQIRQYQTEMSTREIPAGSELALRLFSA